MNLVLAIILFAASFMVGGSEVLLAYPQLVDQPSTTATAIGLQPGDILLQAGGSEAFVNAVATDPIRTTWSAPSAGSVDLTVLRNGASTTLPAVDSAQVQSFLENTSDYVGVMTTRIEQTAPASPAEQAGLQSGDLVYEVNDTVITLETQLGDVVQQQNGAEMTLTVLRDEALVATQMTPRVNPPAGQGALGVQIGAMSTFAPMPFFQSIWQGVVNTFSYIGLVLELPVKLIMGQMSAEAAQLSGPVGIAREVGGAVNSSISYGVLWPILRLSAVLSAALAITNLLPLPALDGGRLLFILIEWIRGKRVSPEREGMVHMIGFMLLLSLMVIITFRDIAAPHATIDWGMILGQ